MTFPSPVPMETIPLAIVGPPPRPVPPVGVSRSGLHVALRQPAPLKATRWPPPSLIAYSTPFASPRRGVPAAIVPCQMGEHVDAPQPDAENAYRAPASSATNSIPSPTASVAIFFGAAPVTASHRGAHVVVPQPDAANANTSPVVSAAKTVPPAPTGCTFAASPLVVELHPLPDPSGTALRVKPGPEKFAV